MGLSEAAAMGTVFPAGACDLRGRDSCGQHGRSPAAGDEPSPGLLHSAPRSPDEVLHPAAGSSFCEFKGVARYWDLQIGERRSERAAWSYPAPSRGYLELKDHLCFYAGRVDACFVDDLLVTAQPGDFYGGWITADIVGPFKGGPGTPGW